MLPLTGVAISLFGVGRWQQALGHSRLPKAKLSPLRESPKSSTIGSRSLEINEARKIARLVRAAANHGVYRANCLQQSLVLWWLLERNGIESKICFGARKEQQKLEAHAWVECFGLALNEDQGVERRFSPFGGVTASGAIETR